MKRKKLPIVLSLLLLCLSAFSAAVQDDEALVIWATDSFAPVLEELGAEFEAEFEIPIAVYELGFGDIRDQFKNSAPAGEGPDIIIGAHDWLGELAANGLLAELDISDVEAEILPAAVAGFAYDGIQYGLPFALENVAFIRNPELVPENPETWDDVRAISEQLVADGMAAQGFVMYDNNPYHFFPLQSAFGGYVFGLTDSGYDPSDVGMDSEGSIAAAAYFEAYGDDGLMPTGIDYDVMHTLFETGDAAMIVTGPWAIPRIEESGISFVVDTLPAGPAGPSQPFLGVWGFMINAFSEKAILAEAFLIDFVATQEVMESLHSADPRPPAFLSAREALEDEIMRGFVAAGVDGLAMPAIPEMSAVWSAWDNALLLMRTGDMSAEEAFSNAGEQIRALLADDE